MEENEKILYHYTSLKGLLRIVESKSIWATNILYLNDASELNYSIELLKGQIYDFQKGVKNIPDHVNWFFRSLVEDITNSISSTFAFFVFSFSEENDLLSQWRGYCPAGKGFSLGFKLNKLMKIIKEYGLLIRPCIYDEEEQNSLFKKLITETYGKFNNEMIKAPKSIYNLIYNKSGTDFYLEFIKLAPILKHPKFKEEKEWRIVGRIDTEDKQVMKFRSGQSMIVPYIEIPLPSEGDNLIINKIIVGPTHEPKLSKASVEMLLKSKDVKYDEVRYSTIPYRNW